MARPKDASEVLDADMPPSDLVEVLERLPFVRSHPATGHTSGPTRCVVNIDRGVRDYPIAAVVARRGK